MPNKVLLKKSSVASKIPLTTDLDYGELALNYTDGKIYFKNASNTIDSFSSSSLTGTVASWAIVSTFAGALNPTDVFFKPDGTKMFVSVATTLNQYTLSTPWDITTAGAVTSFTNTWDTATLGMFISPDGTKLVTCGQTAVVNAGLSIAASEDRAYYLTLSTPWDITTGTLVSSLRFATGIAGLPAGETAPAGITFNSDGTIMYMIGSGVDAVFQYTLTTAYNVGTATYLKQLSISSVETGGTCVTFNAAGSRMYIMGTTYDSIIEFRLSTAWDIATATFYDKLYIGNSNATANGLFIDETSNSAFIVGTTSDLVTKFVTNSHGIVITPQLTDGTGKIDLVGDTRVKNGNLYVNKNIVTDGVITSSSSIVTAGNFTSNQISTSSTALTLGSSASALITIGSTTSTGTITLGQSTAAQTLNLASAATLISITKTVNIGTGGVSGSISNITIGSATAGTDTTLNVTGRVAVIQPTGGRGTVSNTAGSTTVTGVGTAFTRTFQVGDTVTIGVQTVAISAIASDTSMTTAAITNANTTVAYTLTGGTRFAVNGNGNVAIGSLTTPTHKLDIDGGSLGTVLGNQTTILKLRTTTSNAQSLEFTNTRTAAGSDWTTAGFRIQQKVDTTFQGYIQFNGPVNSGGGGGISFGTGGTSSAATDVVERMRIDITGNLGIGTTSPASRLHIRQDQDGTTRQIIQNRNATGTPIAELTFITSSVDLSDSRYAYIQSFGGSSSSITFGTSNGAAPTEKMRIDSAGSVGIGVTGAINSNNKLDVLANANDQRIAIRTLGTTNSVSVEAQVNNYWSGTTYTGTAIQQYDSAATGTTVGIANANLGILRFQNTSAALIYTNGATPIVFGTTNTERMRISSTGIVTITGSISARYTTKSVATTTATSVTPDVSAYNQYAYTALAAGLTINAPIGTPLDGDKLTLRIVDNATSQTLTWNATYKVIGTVLPTATVASKTLYVGCIYNASLACWDVTAVAREA